MQLMLQRIYDDQRKGSRVADGDVDRTMRCAEEKARSRSANICQCWWTAIALTRRSGIMHSAQERSRKINLLLINCEARSILMIVFLCGSWGCG